MTVNSMRFINYSFNGICGHVYDCLDYETHATDKIMRYSYTWGYNMYK